LVLGNQLVREHIFHGYENELLKNLGNQTVATKLIYPSATMDKRRKIEELFGGGYL
jgi:hypothetical protein